MLNIRYFLLFFVFSTCSCVSLTPHSYTSVFLADDATFSYSGRGSGAGVALMSTMGPVGIAVGVAIDEGIRKDLETSAQQAGLDIVALVQSYSVPAQSVEIVEYGMKDVPGTDGLMFPYLALKLVDQDTESQVLLDFNSMNQGQSAYFSLDEYRRFGHLIIEGFQQLLSTEFSDNHL